MDEVDVLLSVSRVDMVGGGEFVFRGGGVGGYVFEKVGDVVRDEVGVGVFVNDSVNWP
jgi:hypothetical protein